MNWHIIKNDLIRNKTINIVLIVFILFSSALAALSALVATQAFVSIADLYQTAMPPHFLQMHKGDFDQKEIDAFVEQYPGVVDWQTVTMIDVYGEDIAVSGIEGSYDLSDSRLDIGLVKQNDTKDLLLDANHQKVVLRPGEIGIPVLLKSSYDIQLGDRITLSSDGTSKEFRVASFVLDSQMNSSLVSSTRILLSDEDYASLAGTIGEYEYLVEVYFEETNQAGDFQTAYQNAGLPQNGQAVTYNMIFLLSAFSDIVAVFLFLLVSILLILVSLICIRYAILAALEEEVGEIGAMKAIGLPAKEIRKLYLWKYRMLALLGAAVGFDLAVSFDDVFTAHISETFGTQGTSLLAIFFALLSAALVYGLMMVACRRILKSINKLTVVDAITGRKGFGKEDKAIRDGLHKAKRLSADWLLALREVTHQFRKWIVVFVVVMIAVLMILVPINLKNTFETPDFITYMGSSLEDILIEVENGEQLEANYAKTRELLSSDDAIKNYYTYKTVRVKTIDKEYKVKNMDVDSGDTAGEGLKYLNGTPPQTQDQIALSYLLAEDLGKETGDYLTIPLDGEDYKFQVSGIYQDVTSGGYTAKSKYGFPGEVARKYSVSVNLIDPTDSISKADAWGDALGAGISVDPMKDFIDQTLGGVVKQLNLLVTGISLVGALLVSLITLLFLKLRIAKDFSELASLKALGFRTRDLRKQYLIKTGWVALTGLLAGVVLTLTLGEQIVNSALALAGIGLQQVELAINPLQIFLYPLGLLALILMFVWVATGTIKNFNIVSLIKE
jgi:putative ABC transport system permease protein